MPLPWLKLRAATLPAVLLLAGCAAKPADEAQCPSGLPDDSGCPDSAPSYATEIAPLVESRCAGCHYEGNPDSTQALESYEDLSDSLTVVEKQIYQCQMPPSGEPGLTLAERQLMLQWLVCGAPNN